MTRFWRDGHYRTSSLGDSHWVEGHWVERNDWDRSSYSQQSQPSILRRYSYSLTYDSFTVPTACPVCRAPVFFYQSPYGGKVFFQRLGPPWPKHLCTDSQRNGASSPVAAIGTALGQGRVGGGVSIGTDDQHSDLEWQQEGWIPIRVAEIKLEDPWFVLKCRHLEDDQYLRLLADEHYPDVINAPAMISPMSDRGFATVSYLTSYGEPSEIPVFSYADFYDVDPMRAADQRKILAER